MTTDLNDVPNNPLAENPEGPVPLVDPADLRRVWELQHEALARSPGEHTSISVEIYKRRCSPGANVGAVWFRASLLGMLEMFGVLAPWIHDGVPTEAVFTVAATFPMSGMPVGVPRQGLSLDVQDFLAQVSKEG